MVKMTRCMVTELLFETLQKEEKENLPKII
jgi:hypothetical protein